jgi:hypothetical protein
VRRQAALDPTAAFRIFRAARRLQAIYFTAHISID